MTKRDEVIAVLNQARGMELLAIHQYMHQHYELDDSDFGELAAQVKLIAIDEMQHAERFAERIKELGGDPATEAAGKVERGQRVQDVFGFDAGEEQRAIDAYNGFLKVCVDNGDSISARMLEEIMDDEQEHLNYFDSVGGHIESLGAAYLAQKAGTSSATGLNTMGFVARKAQQ
jgi:bacterioferritin